eukprot:TRINITY_DN9620_c0_g1_i1.p1 TRINITY_DN9620_c0_g1~~TRINITY_DN9620_c0_g1_i1.p1  ORF type:complete len:160 (+),score=46.83 TRINITY_DN9620_c0_g1_i1:48-482(+)
MSGETVDPATGKNAFPLFCRRCGCKIMSEQIATLEEKQVALPLLKESETTEYGTVWVVKNLHDFDNVGVARPAGNKKFLTCADCEEEVIGVQFIDQPGPFYVPHDVVIYDLEESKRLKQQRPRDDFTANIMRALQAQSSSSTQQ